ncbi:hypothetical protein [uncultured Gulosibacter sp.]|uniref:hypothetical protein n=1 Tax=uncultured Gulosibacter sp. TaxID=1339167 RepID=UPI00288BF592|nr:hypothetical protein [uncultured Gulosibacter sp.]
MPAKPALTRRIDSRLIIGILLVLASMAAVAGIVLASQHTRTVYVANDNLAPGDPLTEDRLALVEVRVDDTTPLYLGPDRLPNEPAVITRAVGAGELIPLSALGAADQSTASVVVTLTSSPPSGVAAGSHVELWVALPGERAGEYAEPGVVVADAVVVRRIEADRLVGANTVELELRVPKTELQHVLAATTAEARMHVVPLYREPATDLDTAEGP